MSSTIVMPDLTLTSKSRTAFLVSKTSGAVSSISSCKDLSAKAAGLYENNLSSFLPKFSRVPFFCS